MLVPLGAPRVEPPRDPNSLHIKHIPVTGSREELLNLFQGVEGTLPPQTSFALISFKCIQLTPSPSTSGFVKLIISEPNKFQNFHRTGWVIYDGPDACQRAINKFNGYRVVCLSNLSSLVLDWEVADDVCSRLFAILGWGNVHPRTKLKEYDIHLGPNHKAPSGTEWRKRVRMTPPAADEDARVEKDANLSARLVRVLDTERGVLGRDSWAGERDYESARRRLDSNIAYLRRVHLYCYYCGEQFDSEEELKRMCGDHQHLRAKRRPDHEVSPEEGKLLVFPALLITGQLNVLWGGGSVVDQLPGHQARPAS